MKEQNKSDKIKSRLNITDMDNDVKKDLFKKFQSVGGKVVSMDHNTFNSNPNLNASKPNKLQDTVKIEEHNIRPNRESSNPFSSTQAQVSMSKGTTQKKSQKAKKQVSNFYVLLVRLTCTFANIFNFRATIFSQKFTDITLKKVYVDLSVLKVILDPVFKTTTKESLDFREYIAQQQLLYEYELAYHTYHMLDDQWFEDLKNTMPASVNKSETYLKLIYSRLYIFYTYYKYMQMAVHLIAEQYEIFFKQKIHLSYTRKKVDDVFFLIWIEWYIWLEELVNYYLVRHNNKKTPQTLEEFLNLTSNSIVKVGQLSTELKTFYEQKGFLDISEEDEGSELGIFPSEIVKNGSMFIVERIDFKNYLTSFEDTKDLRSLFSPTDQLFYAYVLVDYFDKEYNLWNEMNFYVVPGGKTGRFDAKKEIKMLSNQLHRFYELVNDYLRLLRTIVIVENVKGEKVYSEKQEKELSRNSFVVRQNLLSVFEQFNILLTQIITSEGTSKEIVGNWNEILLDAISAESKILYRKTVKEIFKSAQEYIAAVVWLLKHSDLSGLNGKVTGMQVLPNIIINK